MPSTKLSILIPSFKRHGRLYRNVLYFKKLAERNAFPNLLPHLQVVIADGSPTDYQEAATQPLLSLVRSLSSAIDITYEQHPDVHFFDRLLWLSSQASSSLVTLLGDEDLLAFDSIEHIINQFELDASLGSYTGRYVDIHGFLNNHLKFSLHEGWIDTYSIKANTAKERLRLYRTTKGFGLSPVMYSILRRDTLCLIANTLSNGRNTFTYIAGEEVINHIQLSAGKLFSTSKPFILRDLTFIGRSTSEDDWSDPARNLASKKLLKEVLVDQLSVFNTYAEADAFFLDSNPCINSEDEGSSTPLLEYRKVSEWAQPFYSKYLRSQMNPDTYAAASLAWKESAKIAYPATNIRDLGLGGNKYLSRLRYIKSILYKAFA